MADPTLQELKELILNLDKKMDTGFLRVEGEFKRVEGEFKRIEGEIKRVEESLKGEIIRVEESLKGEIKRVEEKVNGIDKRISNEETISRTAFAGLIIAALAGLIKYLFFPQA